MLELLVHLFAYKLPQPNQSSQHIPGIRAVVNSSLTQFSTGGQIY